MATVHQRKTIRDAVVAALLGETAAETRVFATRMLPYREPELPAVAVYTLEESVDPESKSTAPRELTRNLKLAVELAVELDEDVDDALDAFCLQVEDALHADPQLDGAASDSILAGTTIVVDEKSKRPVGVAILNYSVKYVTYAPEPAGSELDDLKTIDAKQSLGGTQAAADQAEDKLEDLDEYEG